MAVNGLSIQFSIWSPTQLPPVQGAVVVVKFVQRQGAIFIPHAPASCVAAKVILEDVMVGHAVGVESHLLCQPSRDITLVSVTVIRLQVNQPHPAAKKLGGVLCVFSAHLMCPQGLPIFVIPPMCWNYGHEGIPCLRIERAH